MSASAVLRIAVCFLLMTFRVIAQTELPNWIPKDAVEIKIETKLLVAEGIAPEELKLGDLQTGKAHFIRVPFVNMLDRPFKIVDIRSSCGCLVGAKKGETVETRGTGDFLALIKPELTDSAYAKSLTVSSDAGVSFQVLISARFKSPFELESKKITLDPDIENLELRLVRVGTEKFEKITVQSKTGFTKVVDLKKEARGDSWSVTLGIAKELFAAVNASRELSEVLKVYDEETGKSICELALNLESGMKLLCKPSPIQLENRDQRWVSKMLLFGTLDLAGSKPVLALSVRDREFEIPITILAKEKNLSRCRIEMDPLTYLFGESASGFVLVNDVRVGLIELLVFPKE